jgi:hypothetical protein
MKKKAAGFSAALKSHFYTQAADSGGLFLSVPRSIQLDSQQTAADIIWSMNSPEFYLLLVEQRGWSPKQFEDWLTNAWRRLLLDADSSA